MFWVEKQALPWYDAVSEDTRTGNDKGNKVFVSAVGVALWKKFKTEVRKKIMRFQPPYGFLTI
jgi:hypothetical protein